MVDSNFSATAEVRTEVTDSSLKEMFTQLRRIRTELIPAAEFDAAAIIVQDLRLRRDTARARRAATKERVDQVSRILCTVTFHANHAHNLTCSP